MDNNFDFNKKIKLIRMTLGLSQNEIGKRIGLTGPHISKLETGKVSISDDILKKYINEFNVNADWLYSNTVDENEEIICVKTDKENSVVTRIKAIRLSLNMSQKQFAKYIGIDQSLVNRIETGKVAPGIQTLNKISEACNTGVDWLWLGDESKKEYPVNKKMIDWLWQHPEKRKEIFERMQDADS